MTTFYVEYQNPTSAKFIVAIDYVDACRAAHNSQSKVTGAVEKIWVINCFGKMEEIDSESASRFQ